MSKRYLLDTHTFLWIGLDPSQLTKRARTAIEDTAHQLYLSYASIWEMAIKKGLGKITMPVSLDEFITTVARDSGVQLLPLNYQDFLTIETLPKHHGDPFDRLLAAQALREQLPILSTDKMFDKYRVRRYW